MCHHLVVVVVEGGGGLCDSVTRRAIPAVA